MIIETNFTPKPTHRMNFGEAIEHLEKGALVARSGWNGKGMFILKQIPTTHLVHQSNAYC